MSQEVAQPPADPSAALPSAEKAAGKDDKVEQANGSGPASNSAPSPSAQLPPPRSTSRGPPSAEDLHRTSSKPTQGGDDAGSRDAQPKKKRSLLNIPRSSSQTQENSNSAGTGLSGATVADTESIGKGSKRSFIGRRRAGSSASSKRSQQRPTTSENPEKVPPVPVPERAESSKSKTKRPAGGLLSCFSCFGTPKGAHPVEDETTENAKQASRVRAGRHTTPTPLKKQEPSAAESSTGESKVPVDEKQGEAYGREGEKALQGDATTDKPSPPKILTRTSSKKAPGNQPLPPIPGQANQLGSPQINIQTPTPVGEKEDVINDRPAEQKEKDDTIEMTTTGPSVPLSKEEVPHDQDTTAQQAQRDAAPAPVVDLPPPPPLAERRDQTISSGGANQQEQDVSSETAPNEVQKWLLPPIRSEFKGKKCLVLDLDETLVHSSFKILHQADFTIPVEIEGQYHNVYVIKRPGVDA